MAGYELQDFLENEVTVPKKDGTRGSALYAVPYRLSGRPDSTWVKLLEVHWHSPSSFTSMHRPNILRVSGDRVVLNGTTLEEVEQYHLKTLKLAIASANRDYTTLQEKRQQAADARAAEEEQHRLRVQEMKDRLKP